MTAPTRVRATRSMRRMAEPAASVPRTYRLTVRARLALTYALLLTTAGAVLLVIVAFVVGLVPSYEFAATAEPAATLMEPLETTPDSSRPAASRRSAVPTSPAVAYDPGILCLDDERGGRGRELAFRHPAAAALGVGRALALLAAGGAWAGWFVAGRMLRPLQR